MSEDFLKGEEERHGSSIFIEYISENKTTVIGKEECVGIIRVYGSVELMIGNKVMTVTSDNVLLAKNETVSVVRNIEPESQVSVIHLQAGVLDRDMKVCLSESKRILDFLQLRPKKGEYLFFDLSKNQLVKQYMGSLFVEILKTEEKQLYLSYNRNVRYSLILFLTTLHRKYEKCIVNTRSKVSVDYDIEKIVEYMEDNYQTATLTSVAEQFSFHPSYFSSKFKKTAECSFSEKLLQIRLGRARTMLATTDLPIQEVIETVGFSEKSYFYKVFKKYYDMTPLQFRSVKR